MIRTSFLALLLLVGAVSTADANPDEEKAKALFNEAETQYRLGEFEKALENYEAALKLRRHPSIVFNIAQCQRQLGQTQKALFFYKLFLSDWERDRPGTQPPNLEEVQEHIRNLTAQLEREKARQRADVPGPSKGAASSKSEGASLTIEGLPAGAKVMVDGTLAQTAPLDGPLALAAGAHEVTIEAEGYAPWRERIELAAGEQASRNPELSLQDEPDGAPGRLWLITGIASGALALGGGILGVAYNIKANNGTPEDFDGQRNVSIAGYVVGGTFAVATAVSFYLYYAARKESPTAPTSAAFIAPTPGGAAVTGIVRF